MNKMDDAGDDESSPIMAQMAAPTPHEPRESLLPDKPRSQREMVQSKTAVLVILFAVTGVLGVPLLWMNKQFTNTERIFWAILVTLYTLFLVYVAYAVCAWSYGVIMGA